MSDYKKIDSYLDRNFDQSLEELKRYVAQPSISAQNLGLKECAQIVQEMWTSIGFKVAVKPLDTIPLLEARKKGDDWLADRVYSSVPAGTFGRKQTIDISPVSGLSNVKYWLEEHGYDPNDAALCDRLFAAAELRLGGDPQKKVRIVRTNGRPPS